MPNVPISLAVGDYEHVRDLTAGKVAAQGIDLTSLSFPVEEIFARFVANREWDVSEFSLAKFTAMIGSGDTSLVGLPVFPSRVFRHSSIYVRSDSTLSRCEQLAGLRIGMPEWAQTAAIYTRGMLEEHHNVRLVDVKWFQAGVNQAGRREKVTLSLPAGLSLRRVTDSSLNEMLITGVVDAVLSARPPTGFSDGSGRIRRLLKDPEAAERSYFEDTGVFPIMHLIAMRAELHHSSPWIARNLTDAFELAKNRSVSRLSDVTASQVPLPWVDSLTRDAMSLFGPDPWPYGIEANRKTLEKFLSYANQQGITPTLLAPESLFAPSTVTPIRV